MDIASLREEYARAELTEESVDQNPHEQFRRWFDEAVSAEVLEPNAMVLSTVGEEGPFQRTVLMKALDQRGIVFYTNYKSRKAQHIEANPRVSVLFPWYPLERQVMVAGKVKRISKAESLKYFASRPIGSQLGAWVSQQSQIISTRSLLESKLAEMKQKFKEGKVPLPDFWGGYLIEPDYFEFWQGRKNRLHDRIQYKLDDSQWKLDRLSP